MTELNAAEKESPGLSPEEWISMKKEEKAEFFRAADEAASKVFASGAELRNYLNMQGRLRYSAANTLVIYARCPGAAQVKGYDEWRRAGQSVLRGEKGIPMLEPSEYTGEDGNPRVGYNVKKVFDVSQTTADGRRPEPGKQDLNRLSGAVLRSTGLPLIASRLPKGECVRFDPGEKVMRVESGAGTDEKFFFAAAREAAHYGLFLENKDYKRDDAQFQADCAACLLCAENGADTSFAELKIPEEMKDREPGELRRELSEIIAAADCIRHSALEYMDRRRDDRCR